MAEEIAKVRDRVLCIANNLGLGLAAVEFFSLDVRQGGGDLAVFAGLALARLWACIKRRTSVFVGNNLCLTILLNVNNAQ